MKQRRERDYKPFPWWVVIALGFILILMLVLETV